jgi:2-aminoethylphosphonate-pyruvate transaminase
METAGMEIKRNVLLNPGPATTADSVKLAQVVPDICPRETEFTWVMDSIRKDIVRIVHGNLEKYTAVLFCGSGTICMDICLNSLLPEKKKVLVINNGAYSRRAVEICDYYGLEYVNLEFEYNRLPDLAVISNVLDKDTDIALVYTTHNETGSGLLNPIRAIGKIAHEHNAVFIVDTTSSYAMIPIDIEKDNVDFCMASAQKGIMAMAGLSFIIGNKDIIERSAEYPKRSYYCNLYLQYDYFKKTGEMHFTPPVQTVYAVKQALKEYWKEGEWEKWKRHKRVFHAIHEGIEKLGFKCLIDKNLQSGLVVAVCYPDDPNWDFNKIHDYCYERGFTIYPGKTAGCDSFRLCAMGAIDCDDIKRFFEVLENVLKDLKVQIPVKYNR